MPAFDFNDERLEQPVQIHGLLFAFTVKEHFMCYNAFKKSPSNHDLFKGQNYSFLKFFLCLFEYQIS